MNIQTEPTNKRPRKKLVPARLPEKLRCIRLAFKLTQAEMLSAVNKSTSPDNRARIHQYETGKRAPSLVEVSNYALFARLPVEKLMNDRLDLPLSLHEAGTQEIERINQIKAANSERRKSKALKAASGDNGEPPNSEGKIKDASAEGGLETADETLTAAATVEDKTLSVAVDHTEKTIPIRLSKQALSDCKSAYIKILEQHSFDKMLPPTNVEFIEMALAVVVNDFRAHGMESAIARRMRLFIEERQSETSGDFCSG